MNRRFIIFMDLKQKVYSYISSGKLAFKTAEQIAKAMSFPRCKKKQLQAALYSLSDEGKIIKDGQGGYATPEQCGAFTGVIRAHKQGFAFIVPDENGFGGDFFVPQKRLAGAYDKDRVLAVPVRGTEDEAQVVKILSRGTRKVVGRFEKDRRAGYVLPDDEHFASDVYIPLSLCAGAKAGDKVVAEITSYPAGKMAGGRIIEILGEDGDFEAEELGIIRSFGLREQFPEEVEKEANEVAEQKIELAGRRDLRGLLTVTIDGEDTRDIDDAVSLEKTQTGFILGVHIADVSHYVKLHSATDDEAFARGTSVYFPDRVLPMLPKALSNGACSLNEGEDRYAMSCIMQFDKRGKRTGCEICESVIKSDKRMTYGEVTSILEKGENADKEYPSIAPMLRDMEELTLLLEKRRDSLGQVSLDVKEAHIYLDERGEIVIPDYERTVSHRLIEQFMVAANEAVAEYSESKKATILFRVHEKPAPEKASAFLQFLNDLGLTFNLDDEDVSPEDYRKILLAVKDKPYSSVVNRVMLRSMQKARYSAENTGHFGLASRCYCHFTSPIRRYPDLFVHRVLKLLLKGETEKCASLYSPIAAQAATQCSEREKQADLAERAVDDLYKVVYMSDRIGEKYDAVISGVTSFGIFAELPNTIEGVIRLENLPADNYRFYEERLLLKGGKYSFRIGDAVRVKVAGCDYGSMRVQFALADGEK